MKDQLRTVKLKRIYGDWIDICAGIVCGLQGSGKTNTARFIAAQSVIHNARLVICDPHGNATAPQNEQTLVYTLAPLEGHYLCAPAISPEDMLGAIRLVHSELQARIDGRISDFPILIIIDEFNQLSMYTDIMSEIGELLESIARQGRKFSVYAMVLSHQAYNSRIAGGGELKSVFAGRWLHRLPRKTAQMLITIGKLSSDVETLKAGEVLFCRPNGDIIQLFIPLTTHADLHALAARLQANKQQINTGRARTNAEKSTFDINSIDVQSAYILRLFYDNKIDASEIARTVFSVKSGPPYQRALADVQAVIREYGHLYVNR